MYWHRYSHQGLFHYMIIWMIIYIPKCLFNIHNFDMLLFKRKWIIDKYLFFINYTINSLQEQKKEQQHISMTKFRGYFNLLRPSGAYMRR